MPNAFGFVGAGVIMELLRFMPDMSGVREMWLLVMGGVLMLTGGLFLAQEGWAWFAPRMITPITSALAQRRPEHEGREAPEGSRAEV